MAAPFLRRCWDMLNWPLRRIPADIDLSDNPLYRRLSGRAYCRRRWFTGRSKRWWKDRAQTSPLVVLGVLLMCMGPLAIIGLVVLIAGASSSASLVKSWREEARMGRLMDLYLSMTDVDLVDALAAQSFVQLRWFMPFVMGVSGVAGACLWTLIPAVAQQGYRWMVGALASAAWIAFFVTPILAHVTVANRYREIAVSASIAASPTMIDKSLTSIASELWNLLIILGGFVLPVGVEIALAVTAFMTFDIAWTPHTMIVTSAVVAVVYQALYSAVTRENLTVRRLAAIASVKRHWGDIVELCPPTSGL